MKTNHLLWAIGGTLAFAVLKNRGFTVGRTPNFSRMGEKQIIAYLRGAYKFDDTKVNEFMSGYREARALREIRTPNFSEMSAGDLYRYAESVFGISGKKEMTTLFRVMDSYLKEKMTPDFYRVKEPELRAFLKKTYNLNDYQVALLFRVYQEIIFKDRLVAAQNASNVPKGWKQKVSDVLLPPWLTWELFSWNTLKAIPGALAKVPEMELKRLMTPSGVAGVVIALLIGPKVLAFWGMRGVSAAAFTVVDYWIASSNAKDIIDGAMRSGAHKGGVAVIAGNIAGTFLGGGAEGTFMRQLAGSLAGNQIEFQLEKTLTGQ